MEAITTIDMLILDLLILLNIGAILLMAMDKQKAKQGSWRVSERTLFLLAAFGGALGIWLGMRLFRHKTKHFAFLIAIPLFFFMHVLLFYLYYHFRFMR